MGGEHILKSVFDCVEGKISNEQFMIIITHVIDVLLRCTLRSKLFPTIGFRTINELSSLEDLPDLETGKL